MRQPVAILGWARTPVAPRGGALREQPAHGLVAPLIQALLQRSGLPASAVDGLLLGNALGAGGNPARLGALAGGLPEHCPALSIDSQCCAGLDAVLLAAARLASGQAGVLLAGGAEAWSRAPIRQHRPASPGQPAQVYERPPFTPWPARDPDPIQAAARHAARQHWHRVQQDRYALASHQRALAAQLRMAREIVPTAGLARDSYPRPLAPDRLARLPVIAAARSSKGEDCSLSTLAISAQADGAALLLLASPAACQRLGLQPEYWLAGGSSIGCDPQQPLQGAQRAATAALAQQGWPYEALDCIELHDAFAVQGLDFQQDSGLPAARINPGGGGLARGHPIGASGAIALVRLLGELRAMTAPPRASAGIWRGLACIAAAGGLGSAVLVERQLP